MYLRRVIGLRWIFYGSIISVMGAIRYEANDVSAWALQTSVSCPNFGSEWYFSGCTAFGYGDDNTIRSNARSEFLTDEYHAGSEFCWRVWDEADDWVVNHMSGAAGVIQHNDEDKGAVSSFSGSSWQSGWLGAWFRNQSWSVAYRSNVLHDVALHEAGHKLCIGGDFGCNGYDEDEVDQAVADCYGQN